MERSPHIWFRIRVALVALSIPAWLLVRAAMPDDFSQPPAWYFPFVLAGFALGSVLVWQMLRGDQNWCRPSWTANPLNQDAPLEGIHLAGWSFIVGALGLLVTSLFHQPLDWAWILPGCIGIGLLAGIWVASTGNAA